MKDAKIYLTLRMQRFILQPIDVLVNNPCKSHIHHPYSIWMCENVHESGGQHLGEKSVNVESHVQVDSDWLKINFSCHCGEKFHEKICVSESLDNSEVMPVTLDIS